MIMDPSSYDMEFSPQILIDNTYNMESHNQPNKHNVDSPYGYPSSSYEHQLVSYGSPHWSQELESNFSYDPNGVTNNASSSSCPFRSEVLNNCGKARFYARALEFYLLEEGDDNFTCLFVDCAVQHNNVKSMLRHVKHCKHFDKGVFRCPPCGRNESFRLRSSTKCRWDREHLGQKIRKFFGGLTNNRLDTQKPAEAKLCCQCKASLGQRSMQGTGPTTHFIADDCTHSAKPPFSPNQLELPDDPRWELASSPGLSELSGAELSMASRTGDLSFPNSPTQAQRQPENPTVYPVSEISSATASPDGDLVNTNISPKSSTHGDIPANIRRRDSRSMVKRVTRCVTELYGQASSNTCVKNQRSASLYENLPVNHGLGPLDTPNPETFLRSANLHPGHLKLRLETSPTIIDVPASTPDFSAPVHRSHTVNYPTTMAMQSAISQPMSFTYSQPNTVPVSDPFSLVENIFMPQSFPNSTFNPPPSASPSSMLNSGTSPSSPSPETELKCHMCEYKPSGKPEEFKNYLKKHIKGRHGESPPTNCPYCGKMFTRSDNMGAHCKRKHNTSSTSPSKRRRDSSDSLLPPSPLKRRNTAKGRTTRK